MDWGGLCDRHAHARAWNDRLVKEAMRAIPMPIVMGMVAGVPALWTRLARVAFDGIAGPMSVLAASERCSGAGTTPAAADRCLAGRERLRQSCRPPFVARPIGTGTRVDIARHD